MSSQVDKTRPSGRTTRKSSGQVRLSWWVFRSFLKTSSHDQHPNMLLSCKLLQVVIFHFHVCKHTIIGIMYYTISVQNLMYKTNTCVKCCLLRIKRMFSKYDFLRLTTSLEPCLWFWLFWSGSNNSACEQAMLSHQNNSAALSEGLSCPISLIVMSAKLEQYFCF